MSQLPCQQWYPTMAPTANNKVHGKPTHGYPQEQVQDSYISPCTGSLPNQPAEAIDGNEISTTNHQPLEENVMPKSGSASAHKGALSESASMVDANAESKNSTKNKALVTENDLIPTQIINVSKRTNKAHDEEMKTINPAEMRDANTENLARGSVGNHPKHRHAPKRQDPKRARAQDTTSHAAAKPAKSVHKTNSTVPDDDESHSQADTPVSVPNNRMNTASTQQNNTGSIDQQAESRRDKYRQKKCLVVHSGVFKDFQVNYFSREFDITCLERKWTKDLAQDRKLRKSIEDIKPECIFIHMGAHEVHEGKRKQETLSSLEDFLWYLIDATQARICVSTVIPTTNNEPLNEKIRELNDGIRDIVTDLRKERPDLEEHLFSYFNDSVGWQNKKLHEGFVLSDLGQKIMWKRLKDGLCKTLRLPRKQFRRNSRQENSKNND